MDSSRRETTVHGTFVEIDGVGVLITGPAGSGKSDAAAKLLLAGKKLVADDVVIIERRGDRLVGRASERQYGLMSVRGLGIVNAELIFGAGSVIPECSLDLIVDIAVGPVAEEPRTTSILGVDVTVFLVVNTRDIASFAELAALSVTRGASIRLDDITVRNAA